MSSEQRMTLEAVATELEISLSTLNAWIKLGLPARKRGGRWAFDLEAAKAWVSNNKRLPVGDSRRADADLRKVVALAELRELELKKRRGEVIDRGAVAEAVGAMAYTLRRRLLGLPAHLSTRCAGKSVEEIDALLGREIQALLGILASAPYAEAPLLCERCASAQGVAPRLEAAAG